MLTLSYRSTNQPTRVWTTPPNCSLNAPNYNTTLKGSTSYELSDIDSISLWKNINKNALWSQPKFIRLIISLLTCLCQSSTRANHVSVQLLLFTSKSVKCRFPEGTRHRSFFFDGEYTSTVYASPKSRFKSARSLARLMYRLSKVYFSIIKKRNIPLF